MGDLARDAVYPGIVAKSGTDQTPRSPPWTPYPRNSRDGFAISNHETETSQATQNETGILPQTEQNVMVITPIFESLHLDQLSVNFEETTGPDNDTSIMPSEWDPNSQHNRSHLLDERFLSTSNEPREPVMDNSILDLYCRESRTNEPGSDGPGNDFLASETFEAQSRDFWTWDAETNRWYHKDLVSGETIWAPLDFD